MILLVVALAGIFAYALSTLGVIDPLADAIAHSGLGEYGVLALIVLLLMTVGMFLDGISIFLIFVPLLLPIANAFHWNPVWFGVVLTLKVALGQFTPPLAVNLMVSCRIARVRMEETVPWVIWMLLAMFIAMLMVLAYPPLATGCPTGSATDAMTLAPSHTTMKNDSQEEETDETPCPDAVRRRRDRRRRLRAGRRHGAELTSPSTRCRWCSVPPSWGKGGEIWADLVRQRTNGRINIKLYPGTSLVAGDQTREFSAIRQGVIDMAVGSTINWSPQVKELNLFSLPFLMPDYKALDALTQGEVGKSLFATLEKGGVVPLAWGENGFREVSNSSARSASPKT